jgi:hypothetical protein
MHLHPTPQRIRWNRRNFLKTATLASGAVVFGVPTLLRGQNLNSKLNIACIGAMGKGQSDTDCCVSENIVALCDVDSARSVRNILRQNFIKIFAQCSTRWGPALMR